MLKKIISYQDFNDETVVEECFFHLSKAELVELEVSHEGGLSESLQKIIASEDGKAVIAEFKNIILGSFGKKSPDGKRFVKTQAQREEFESSEAYSTLFMELVTDAEAAVEFINGVIPADMAEAVARFASSGTDAPVELRAVDKPASDVLPPELETIQRSDLHAMSTENFNNVMERVTAGEVKIIG